MVLNVSGSPLADRSCAPLSDREATLRSVELGESGETIGETCHDAARSVGPVLSVT